MKSHKLTVFGFTSSVMTCPNNKQKKWKGSRLASPVGLGTTANTINEFLAVAQSIDAGRHRPVLRVRSTPASSTVILWFREPHPRIRDHTTYASCHPFCKNDKRPLTDLRSKTFLFTVNAPLAPLTCVTLTSISWSSAMNSISKIEYLTFACL